MNRGKDDDSVGSNTTNASSSSKRQKTPQTQVQLSTVTALKSPSLTQAQNTAGYISGQSALAHQKTQNQRPWFLPRLSLTHPVLGLTAPQILQPTALSFVDIVRVRFRDNLAVYHEFVQSLAQLSTRGKKRGEDVGSCADRASSF